MTISDRVPVGGRAARIAALLALAVAPAAHAQEQGDPAFTPTLFVLGSTTDNEFRTAEGTVGDSSLYAELELPFTFDGPRWSGGFSLNPAMRRQRELRELDEVEASVDGWLRGDLSPRTRLVMTAGVARSSQLTGLDRIDLVTERADRVHSRAAATLTHSLNPAGDTLDLRAEFGQIEYLDGDFVSERSYAIEGGYGRALTPRLSVYVGGGVGRFEYDGGGAVHDFSPRAGLDYRIGPRTDLELRGGVTFSRGDVTRSGTTRATDTQTVVAEASLGHSGRDWSVGLTAGRDVASGIALGEPTVRTRLQGSVDWGDPRWRLGLSGGVARNALLTADDGLVLLTEDGIVVTDSEWVDTYGACADIGFRFTRWMSLVGTGRLVQQRPSGGADSLRLDVYRFSLGIAVHPYAGPIQSRRGAEILRRYGRAGSIGSC